MTSLRKNQGRVFTNWLAGELKRTGIRKSKLARLTGVSESTVYLWFLKSRLPHAFIQRRVRQIMKREARNG